MDVSESKALDPPEDPQRIEETSVNQSDSVSKIRKKVVILMCFFFLGCLLDNFLGWVSN